jgi:hypothetical protein
VKDEPLQLMWWEICDFGSDKDRQGRHFHHLERQGWIGYCLSCESRFEAIRLRKWLNTNIGRKNYFLSRYEECRNYHSSIGNGYYNSASRCLWMIPGYQTQFQDFMESFVPRDVNISTPGYLTPMVKNILKGINYAHYAPLNISHDECVNGMLTLTPFSHIDRLQVMLALSR